MRRGLPVLAAALCWSLRAAAQLPDDVEVGAYVEVRGETRVGGGLVAREVGVRTVAEALDRVRGPVEASAPAQGTLRVAGVRLRLASDARLTDAAGGALDARTLRLGSRVDARGVYENGELLVRALSVTRDAGTAGRVKLGGRIDAVDAEVDSFRLLGVGIRVTRDTRVELD